MPPVFNGLEKRGLFSKEFINFYSERAEDNGVSLFVIKDGIIGITGKKYLSNKKISNRYLRQAYQLTSALHKKNSKVILQLQHYGAEANHPFSIAASKIKNRETHRISNKIPAFMVEKIIQSYAKKASDAINLANFDGVEINGSGLTLPNTFTCPGLNRRSDQWGTQGRHNFAIELVKRVRSYIGPTPILTYRLSLMDLTPNGMKWSDLIALAKALQFEGVNAFCFDVGLSPNLIPRKGDLTPEGVWDNFIQYFSNEIKVPVFFGINIESPVNVLKILSENSNCFVEIGEPLIADSKWVKKVQDNKTEEIIPYIEKTIELLSSSNIKKNIIYDLAISSKKEENEFNKKVLIVGGGPTGIAAAKTAAEYGCIVTLAEERDQLGGLFRIGSSIPGRENISRLIDIWEQELIRLNVTILKNTTITASIIDKQFNDYEIILATGRETAIPDISGIDSPNVLTVEDLLEHQIPVGHRVAVIGSTTMTVDVVRYLCAPLIEDKEDWLCAWGIGNPKLHQGGVFGVIPHLTTPERHTNLINLDKNKSFESKLLEQNRFYDIQWLRMHGVNTFEHSTIEQIDTHSLKMRLTRDSHSNFSLRADHIVIVDKFDPRNELSADLRELDRQHVLAGSVTKAEAIYSASEGISDGIEAVKHLLNYR